MSKSAQNAPLDPVAALSPTRRFDDLGHFLRRRYDWVWQASYAPHGPVHFMIGGYTNCGDLDARLQDIMPESASQKLQLNMINVPKNLWRSHALEMPEYCSMDTPQAECHLICQHNTSDLSFGETTFADGGTFGMWVLELGRERYEAFLDVLCTTPWSPGEQMESASPADVSFWPIHPTMDRLLQYKRLAKPFVNGTWARPHANPDPMAPDATQYCEYRKYGCSGHHPWDITASKARALNETTGHFEERWLTNGELFHIMNPNEYYMHYVYDNFEWSHCDAEGHRFPRLEWAQ